MESLFNKAQKEGFARCFDSLTVATVLTIVAKASGRMPEITTEETFMLIYGLITSLGFAAELRRELL